MGGARATRTTSGQQETAWLRVGAPRTVWHHLTQALVMAGQLDITGTPYRRSARLLSTAAVPGTPTTSCRWTSATTTARTWRGGILENLDLEFQWRRRHWRQQTIVACHRHGDHAKATLSGGLALPMILRANSLLGEAVRATQITLPPRQSASLAVEETSQW